MKNLTKVGAVCLLATLAPSANAFFGLGGCPKNVPSNLNAPYGASPQVPNDVYYTHYYDYSWAEMQAAKQNPQPTSGRTYLECEQTQITSNNYGATYARSVHWEGSVYDSIQYNLYCQGNICADQQQMYAIQSVYYDSTYDYLINYFCFDFSSIIKAVVPAIENALPLKIPPFLITLIANQFNIVHMSWMEVMSTSQTLSDDAIASISAYVSAFPISNIGSSGTFLDLLAPYLTKKGGLFYSMSYFETINQDPSVCY